jgi:apolipoprotein N-acyltransferase
LKISQFKLSELLFASLTAFTFSLFIYLEEFSLKNQPIEMIAGLVGIGLVLILNRRILLLSGFFIGILWFFWIGFSMQYYGFSYLVPVVTVAFGVIYAFHLYFIGFYQNIWFRASTLSLVNLFEPFGFNWFKPQIIFINTPLGTSIFQFGAVVFTVAFLIYFRERKSLYPLAIFPIMFALNISSPDNREPSIKISVVETDIMQGEKWLKENQNSIIEMNFKKIESAIKEGYNLVVIPESTFPLFINRRPDIIKRLSKLSYKIAIWTGGLYSESGNYYNTAYLFQNGEYRIAKKVVLVPFGEYIPLPKFLANWLNEIFFGGVQDFTPATQPTDFNISGELFRSAICYEASSKELYIDSPDYMIAISNNGWFLPSIEPSLQKLLIQHYSNLNGVTVFHSANRRGTGVIYPQKGEAPWLNLFQ